MFACSASLFVHAVVFYYHVFLNANKHLLTLKPGQLYVYRSQNCKQTSLLSFYRMKCLPLDGTSTFLWHQFKQLEDWICRMSATVYFYPVTTHIQTVLQWLGNGLDDWVIGVRFPVVARVVSGAHQWAAGSLYSGVKQPERLADNSNLEPRLRIHGAILLHACPWHVLNQAYRQLYLYHFTSQQFARNVSKFLSKLRPPSSG